MEDVVTRAARLLLSPKSDVKITCSSCENVALRLTTNALHLGSSTGVWSHNKLGSAMFMNIQDQMVDNTKILLVKKGAIVLTAQQIVCGGIEHELKGNGFRTHLKPVTQHHCLQCSRSTGSSLRLRIDAKLTIDTEVALIDNTIPVLVSDNVKIKICCSAPACSVFTHKGMILPSRTSTVVSPETVTCAMGSIDVCASSHMSRHGQLLYFSRNTGTLKEVGILIWVVDQRVAVVEVEDVAEIFKRDASSYDLVSINKKCHIHQEFPLPCATCTMPIFRMDTAVKVDLIDDGYVKPYPIIHEK